MAGFLRLLGATPFVLLVTVAMPTAVADGQAETRSFYVGGDAGPAALPASTQDDERCDFECDFTIDGARLVVIDVRGPEGRSFPYEYQLSGCDEAQPTRQGHGHNVIGAQGCTSLTIRPVAVEADVPPWRCTSAPFSKKTPVENPVRNLALPLSSETGDYTSPTGCAASCAEPELPHSCLPTPRMQAGGTVRISW